MGSRVVNPYDFFHHYFIRAARGAHQLFELAQLALEPETFSPKEAHRRFTIAANNYAAVVLTPAVIAAATDAAPFVQLDIRPSGTLNVLDLIDIVRPLSQ